MSVEAEVVAKAGRHAVILCHPDPRSFNHGIAEAYCDAVRNAGQSVVMRDLYALGFDPVLKADERPTLASPLLSADVAIELDMIAGSDVFVLIYPIWFASPPAMMKGYIERVLGSRVRPEAIQKRARTDLLGKKRLLSFTTSAASGIWLNEQGQEQGLRSVFDDYLVHAFGMHSQDHKRFDHITADLGQRFADQHFLEVATQAQRTCAQIAFGDEALLRDPTLARRFTR
ncbi:NAD(P)H-dependent oxidoreductase [Sphingomonas sp. HMP9]|uniref:NAD(P)H-dependent oxidoreductase n=1 Tax=Sphingomonas sp. HMP9 TaxID=1517554 RepID=UPI0015967B4C|nr:NAD(P)H-dependent oxidoreductase [Sphingomonas sp. HMP9]